MRYNSDFMLVLAGFAAVGQAKRFTDYVNYVAQHSKNYKDVETIERHWVQWQQSDDVINQINRNSAVSSNSESSTAGHNFTSDMTPFELANLTGRTQHADFKPVSLSGGDGLQVSADNDVNHATAGFTTPVKDQGGCGSCWSFGANSTLEGALAIQANQKNPVRLSEQEAVDCSTDKNDNINKFGKDYKNRGCSGGLEYWLWDFQRDHGSMADKDYPYKAVEQQCQRGKDDTRLIVPKGKVTGWKREEKSVSALTTRIQTTPIAIGVDANCQAYQFYKSGIITFEQCPGGGMNHSNSVVGLSSGEKKCTVQNWWYECEGTDAGNSHWIVQNSWGTTWGENGFAKFEVAEGDGVACMNCDATWPTLLA